MKLDGLRLRTMLDGLRLSKPKLDGLRLGMPKLDGPWPYRPKLDELGLAKK